jgi:hypothetical protein
MFAPAVRSLDAPVAVRVTGPEALMAPVGDTTPPVMLTPPPLAVRVPAPEYVPETEMAAALTAPDPVSTEPELEIPTSPPAEIVCVVLEKDLDVPVEVMVTLPLVESMFELRIRVPPSIATLPTV